MGGRVTDRRAADTRAIAPVVDHLHQVLGYRGGRLSLADLFDVVPGILLSLCAMPEGTQGAVRLKGGCVSIAVEKTLPKPEQRAAIAHELGHALLHLGHLRQWGLPASEETLGELRESVREEQAECFAALLLAPPWAVKRALKDSPRRPASRITQAFDVPLDLAREAVLAVIDAFEIRDFREEREEEGE